MVLTLPNEEIERLWFGGLSFEPGKAFPQEAITRWFSQTAEFDKKCRPYEGLIHKVSELPAAELLALSDTPENSLTLVLLLDQIARNIKRGPEAAWAYTHSDPAALHVLHHCLRIGHDKAHPPHKRFWYYLGLSHSENMLDQELALARSSTLTWEIRTTEWKSFHGVLRDSTKYIIKFYTTIDKFGRFPQRNEVLKRESTAEEKEFLKSWS